ncbi:transcriptional regulator, CarD family [Ruminococcaceae bacterium YRB3002]|nr:transcriptional regulator, CarD family [Ruminococcaceae bacterium YRB3002]
MGFAIGDAIVYGGSGVCEIEDIRDISFSRGRSEKYYVLKPMFTTQSSVLYVPVGNKEQVSKLHPVISKDEAMAIIRKIPIRSAEWVEDRNLRRETFNGIVNTGSREEIVSLISLIEERRDDLMGAGKKLNAQDERVLSDALKRINSEFAVALGMDPDSVDRMIRTRDFEQAQ